MGDKRMEGVFRLMRRYDLEEAHSRHVCKLALELFDQLQALHGLSALERQWLEAAALLHDIGWSQAVQAHHKASLRLILHERLPGWSDEEALIIANIARYHRKSLPCSKHRHFARLSSKRQESVIRLAALLRLADGLDSLHDGRVKRITCTSVDAQVRICLAAGRDASPALAGLDKKKELFEEHYRRKLVLDAAPA
ncbi:HD domain-containing protein [bacterium]|nr:HD domain-containing protein [bacterium]